MVEYTKAEEKALLDYTGGDSLYFNNYLRRHDMSEFTRREMLAVKRKIRLINSMIRKNPKLRKKIVVYRGAEAMQPHWRHLQSGYVLEFTNKGLISTSLSKDVALSFVEDDDDCCLLVLTLPPGTAGLMVPDSYFDYEKEFILPHGSIFIVDKVAYTPYENRSIKTYHATLQPGHLHDIRRTRN